MDATPGPPTASGSTPPGAGPPSLREPPPMCYACGQLLAAEQIKCPSCGAPVRSAQRRRGGNLTVAGVLFLGLFLLIVAQGAMAVFGAESALQRPQPLAPISFSLSGSVLEENGTGLSGVRVTVMDQNQTGIDTDASGTFLFRDVPGGYHQVRVERANYTTVEVRVFLLHDDAIEVRLAPGNATRIQEDSSFHTATLFLNVCGGLLFGVGLMMLAGALACFRRRRYGVALAASLLSMLGTLTYLPAILLSIIALVLVVRARKEFR